MSSQPQSQRAAVVTEMSKNAKLFFGVASLMAVAILVIGFIWFVVTSMVEISTIIYNGRIMMLIGSITLLQCLLYLVASIFILIAAFGGGINRMLAAYVIKPISEGKFSVQAMLYLSTNEVLYLAVGFGGAMMCVAMGGYAVSSFQTIGYDAKTEKVYPIRHPDLDKAKADEAAKFQQQ